MGGPLVAAGVISSLTFLTNVLGFVREVLFARAFGATEEADGFIAAFSIVATCYLVLGGAALQGAFMPRYQKAILRDNAPLAKGLWGFVVVVFSFGAIVIGILIYYNASHIVSWVVPGFDLNARVQTAQLVRWLVPMIVFCSVGTILQSVLHAHQSFVVPAAIPIGNNIIIILFLIALVPIYGLVAMAYGTVVGASLWLLLLRPAMRYLPSGRGSIDLCSIRELVGALLPLFVLVGIDQVAALVQKTLVSHLDVGSIAVLNYAARLVGLPVGIFAAAIAAAFFPYLVKVVTSDDHRGLQETFTLGVAAAAFVLLPCSAFLIAESELVVGVLLERGAFSSEATVRTASAVALYSIGLFAQGLIVFLNRVYFSLGNTRTPMIIGAIAATLHIFFCWVAVELVGYLGVAIGTTLYAILYVLILAIRLNRIVPRVIGVMAQFVWRPFVASCAAFGVTYAWDFPNSIIGLGVATAICGTVYLLIVGVLKDPMVGHVISRLKTRGR